MLILSAVTVCLGSALLFAVQPMVAKRLLPLLGGAPGVWNGCMLFFQGALLLGYLWAHRAVRRGGVAPGLGWHALLLAAGCASLPLALPAGGAPDPGTPPVAWLLGTLALMVGLPALALATTAPLAQAWFASSAHPRARDPYFLYAASNLGSAAALLGYPLLVEPRLPHDLQERAWSVLFVLLAVLLITLGALVRRRPGAPLPAATQAPPTPLRERLSWLLLAALPSALVIAATQHVTTDIASVPLLWIAPLLIYLCTYVVAFSGRGPAATRMAGAALPPLVLLAVLLTVFGERGSVMLQLVAHLSTLCAVALLAHGRLAARRPEAARLTTFYLWLALGGVLGGAFVSLLAPVVFEQLWEYPLLLVAGCLLRDGSLARPGARTLLRDLLAPAAALCVLVLVGQYLEPIPSDTWVFGVGSVRWLSLAAVMTITLLASRGPRGLALAVAALCLAPSPVQLGGELLHRERSFFGVSEVWATHTDAGSFHLLVNGTTTHGVQGVGALADEPTSYYGAEGAMGDLMRQTAARGSADVAVVGLGAGALALHGRPGWRMTFFEMDPLVADLAADPALFDCLARSPAETAVVLGDGRLTLGASDARFDLIVLDAFSSDAVPVHLLTLEAIGIWLEHLREGGLLVFNVSNDFLALTQVLAAAAAELNLACLGVRDDVPEPERRELLRYPSQWAVLMRAREDVDPANFGTGWGWLTPLPFVRPWTDDFSSLLSAMRRDD